MLFVLFFNCYIRITNLATSESPTAAVPLVNGGGVFKCAFQHLTPAQGIRILTRINLGLWMNDCILNNHSCGTIYQVSNGEADIYEVVEAKPIGPFR
jgi:hypothetical protein